MIHKVLSTYFALVKLFDRSTVKETSSASFIKSHHSTSGPDIHIFSAFNFVVRQWLYLMLH